MNFELKRWKEKYTNDAELLMNDEDILCCMSGIFPDRSMYADAGSFISSRLVADEEREYCRAIIIDGHACGCIHMQRGRGCYDKTGIITFWLSSDHRGEGIMTSALRTFIHDIRERYDIIRLNAFPFADNTAARCILNNCGFDREGTLRKAAVKNDKMHDICVYSLLCD